MTNKKTPPLPDLYYGNNSPNYYVIHFIMWRNIFVSLLSLTQNNGSKNISILVNLDFFL